MVVPREGGKRMKPMVTAYLLLATTALLGQSKREKNSVEQVLIQIEHEWSQADIEKDATALNRILAEDWIGIDFEGTVLTKAQALRGIRSDSASLESTVLRDMKVRVYGNTAIVTGTDTEKGEYHGQDSSGKYLWTDVFVRRNGRWQAVSSQSTKLTRPEGPTVFAKLRGTGNGRN
jgi:ketosteroid isomerase-like protein